LEAISRQAAQNFRGQVTNQDRGADGDQRFAPDKLRQTVAKLSHQIERLLAVLASGFVSFFQCLTSSGACALDSLGGAIDITDAIRVGHYNLLLALCKLACERETL